MGLLESSFRVKRTCRNLTSEVKGPVGIMPSMGGGGGGGGATDIDTGDEITKTHFKLKTSKEENSDKTICHW